MLNKLVSRMRFEHLFVYILIIFIIFLIVWKFKDKKLLEPKKVAFSIFISSVILFSLEMFEIDIFKGNIFFQGDTYADAVKLFLSYEHIFNSSNLESRNVPYEWIYANPYSTKLEFGSIANMHLPPFYTVHNILLANIFAHTSIGIYTFVYIYFLIYLLIAILTLKYNSDGLSILLFILTYPSLTMFQRGNIVAGICGLLIFLYVQSVLTKKSNLSKILLLVLAASYRPNLLIFSLLLIIPKNLKKSLFNLSAFSISYFFFNLSNYLLLLFLYPNYSFKKFIVGVRWQTDMHLDYGDGFDSSIYRALRSFLDITDYTQQRILQFSILVTGILVALLLTYFAYNKRVSTLEFSLALLSLSLISISPIGDYHLISCVLFIYLIYKFEANKTNNIFILLLSIIILPKFHNPLYADINYSLFINNSSLVLIIFFVTILSFLKINRPNNF